MVSLYTLNIATQLTCKVQVASLLHEDSWMGTWTERGDGSPKIVAWYTRRELPSLIFAHFFASQQHLGRQAHLAKYWEMRVTPELLALTAAALRCALTDYETGQRANPPNDFKREIYASKNQSTSPSQRILGPQVFMSAVSVTGIAFLSTAKKC